MQLVAAVIGEAVLIPAIVRTADDCAEFGVQLVLAGNEIASGVVSGGGPGSAIVVAVNCALTPPIFTVAVTAVE